MLSSGRVADGNHVAVVVFWQQSGILLLFCFVVVINMKGLPPPPKDATRTGETTARHAE